MEIFKLGVPHRYDGNAELASYTAWLRALKDKLQELTGKEISQERISNAIGIYNRMRELFKKIGLLRRDSSPPLSALDFARLNHASFYADPVFMVDVMGSIYEELRERKRRSQRDGPRLMLIGPNIADGEYRILELA